MENYTVRNLTFTYPGQNKKALDNLSFSVNQGEFVTLIGPSGCGKSTLLRHLKTTLTPYGCLRGKILFEDIPLSEIDHREQSARIGFVTQNPDTQIVTDKVWHELAFGLESLGYDTPTIRRRVAEMSSFFGIQDWFHMNVSELSGGQKQLLNLASIMAMQPSVLILDEPTSQLDPIAATNFLGNIRRINQELGTTIIITEHRLEEVFPMSDWVLVMEEGKLLCEGTPGEVGEKLKHSRHSMFLAMPTPMRIYGAVPNKLNCPITVRDGRLWLDEFSLLHKIEPTDRGKEKQYRAETSSPTIEVNDVWFKYDKNLPDVLRGLSLKGYPGEFLAVLGGNGTGKTTVLSLILGNNKPYRGKVLLKGQELSQHENLFDGLLGVLPQNPQALFVKQTVREDLFEILKDKDLPQVEKENKIASISRLCRLEKLLEQHPYDLSGGEQQRTALAKVLLLEPQILLLDEPTKGLDPEFKLVFAEILQNLLHQEGTVIMVSHDIEFCAKYAHRCAMLFDGNIVTEGTPRSFFSGNTFYTTSANRMARHLLPDAITAEDVIVACGGKVPESQNLSLADYEPHDYSDKHHDSYNQSYHDSRGDRPYNQNYHDGYGNRPYNQQLTETTAEETTEEKLPRRHSGNASFIKNEPVPIVRPKLAKRTVAAAVMIFLAIPLTIYLGIFYLENRRYYFIALLVILEAMLPFILVFEGRKPQARELVVIAVLCALGVVGRGAFFMLPQFKPVTAIVIISGVAFGGEVGFLVGIVTIFVSNIMFGHGPWTPVQMFAMGLIGFLAGVLFKKGFLSRSRLPLCIFGALATIVIYGGLMNPTFLLMSQPNPTWPMLIAVYISGLPLDLIHASATVFFLWLFSQPMLEKLDRVKVKYGLMK